MPEIQREKIGFFAMLLRIIQRVGTGPNANDASGSMFWRDLPDELTLCIGWIGVVPG